MQKSDYKNMWVYIEHDGKTAAPVGLELCCEIRRLCGETGDKLYAVILSDLPEAEIEKVHADMENAQLRYEYETAARLKYSDLPALEKQLSEAEKLS